MRQADLLDPFLPTLDVKPEGNRGDERAAVNHLLIVSGLVPEVLTGQRNAVDLFDALSDSGTDPDDYISGVVAEVEYITDGGVRFVSNETGLMVPESCLGQT